MPDRIYSGVNPLKLNVNEKDIDCTVSDTDIAAFCEN